MTCFETVDLEDTESAVHDSEPDCEASKSISEEDKLPDLEWAKE